jgi:hypothetical protein
MHAEENSGPAHEGPLYGNGLLLLLLHAIAPNAPPIAATTTTQTTFRMASSSELEPAIIHDLAVRTNKSPARPGNEECRGWSPGRTDHPADATDRD